jgi:hypothetical protein
MATDKRSTVAVSAETAARLKTVSDAAGMTVGELLRLASMEPGTMTCAALEGLVREGQARLEKARKRAGVAPASSIPAARPASTPASSTPAARPAAAPASSTPAASQPAKSAAPRDGRPAEPRDGRPVAPQPDVGSAA